MQGTSANCFGLIFTFIIDWGGITCREPVLIALAWYSDSSLLDVLSKGYIHCVYLPSQICMQLSKQSFVKGNKSILNRRHLEDINPQYAKLACWDKTRIEEKSNSVNRKG